MKDFILNNITMIDILDKYGIKRKGNQFLCPFHKDKTPSAKAYKNSYYCFGCNKTGDLIQFIEDYFNISFVDAMSLINNDFNLGLSFRQKQDMQKIKEAQKKNKLCKQIKEHSNKLHNKIMIYLCKQLQELEQEYNKLENQINPYNWEEIEEKRAKIHQRIEALDYEFNLLNIKKR